MNCAVVGVLSAALQQPPPALLVITEGLCDEDLEPPP